jgi:hypothetical protein
MRLPEEAEGEGFEPPRDQSAPCDFRDSFHFAQPCALRAGARHNARQFAPRGLRQGLHVTREPWPIGSFVVSRHVLPDQVSVEPGIRNRLFDIASRLEHLAAQVNSSSTTCLREAGWKGSGCYRRCRVRRRTVRRIGDRDVASSGGARRPWKTSSAVPIPSRSAKPPPPTR